MGQVLAFRFRDGTTPIQPEVAAPVYSKQPTADAPKPKFLPACAALPNVARRSKIPLYWCEPRPRDDVFYPNESTLLPTTGTFPSGSPTDISELTAHLQISGRRTLADFVKASDVICKLEKMFTSFLPENKRNYEKLVYYFFRRGLSERELTKISPEDRQTYIRCFQDAAVACVRMWPAAFPVDTTNTFLLPHLEPAAIARIYSACLDTESYECTSDILARAALGQLTALEINALRSYSDNYHAITRAMAALDPEDSGNVAIKVEIGMARLLLRVQDDCPSPNTERLSKIFIECVCIKPRRK